MNWLNWNWFLDVVKNKYVMFKGRASRKEFWTYILHYFILFIVASILDYIVGLIIQDTDTSIISGLLSLALLLPTLAVTVRRLHDTGRSGWWLLIGLTGIGGILLLIWYVTDSQPSENKYGPNPKGIV
jgi:uncharacterized membrane protein YhaH (DUF805 family)